MIANLTAIRHRSEAGNDNVVNIDPVDDSLYQSSVDPALTNNIIDDYDLYNLTFNYDLSFATLT